VSVAVVQPGAALVAAEAQIMLVAGTVQLHDTSQHQQQQLPIRVSSSSLRAAQNPPCMGSGLTLWHMPCGAALCRAADAVKHWHKFSDDLFKEAKAMAPKGVEAVAPTELSCVIMDNKALSPAEVSQGHTGTADRSSSGRAPPGATFQQPAARIATVAGAAAVTIWPYPQAAAAVWHHSGAGFLSKVACQGALGKGRHRHGQ
jgi:hypothetical protein